MVVPVFGQRREALPYFDLMYQQPFSALFINQDVTAAEHYVANMNSLRFMECRRHQMPHSASGINIVRNAATAMAPCKPWEEVEWFNKPLDSLSKVVWRKQHVSAKCYLTQCHRGLV